MTTSSPAPRPASAAADTVVDRYSRPGRDRDVARDIHAQAVDRSAPITGHQVQMLLTIGYLAGAEESITADVAAEPFEHPAYGDPSQLDTPTARMTPGPSVWRRINDRLAHLVYRTK